MKRLIGTAMRLALLVALTAGVASAFCYSTGQHPAAKEASSVIKLGAGNQITYFSVENFDTSNAKSAMLFDASAVPTTGTAPLFQVPVPVATSSTSPSFNSQTLTLPGYVNQNGIVAACSSTAGTLTVDASANCFFTVCYQ